MLKENYLNDPKKMIFQPGNASNSGYSQMASRGGPGYGRGGFRGGRGGYEDRGGD